MRDLPGYTQQRWFTRYVSRIFLLGLTIGCHADTTGPAPIDPARLYWQLTLNHHAITMALTAPYDTIQLTATPRSATGDLLADSGTTYRSTDSTKVTVSPQGLVTAVAPTSDVKIIASHSNGLYTIADTARVNVNQVATVPFFSQLTLQPPAGDSAVLTISDGFSYLFGAQVAVSALDQNNTLIPNVVFAFSAADTTILTFADYTGQGNKWNPSINATNKRVGSTMIYAEATIYGVRRVDSLRYAVGYPTFLAVAVLPKAVAGQPTPIGYFSPGTITIGVGSVVVWYSNLTHGQPIDVVFDTPGAVQPEDSVDFAATYGDYPTPAAFASYFWVYNYVAGITAPNDGGGNIASFTHDSTCVGGTFADTTYGYPCSDGIFYYNVRARKFTEAGVYPYHSDLYGTGGVINVVKNP